MSLRPIYGGVNQTKPCPPILTKNTIVIDYIKQLSSLTYTLNKTFDRSYALTDINRIKNAIQNDIVNNPRNTS